MRGISRLGRRAIPPRSGRGLGTYSTDTMCDPAELYSHAKQVALDNSRVPEVSKRTVFANNEISLRDIQVWGFDYDYTLADYKPRLNELIYNIALKQLVKSRKYPDDILHFKYNPNLVCRGLHYDIRKGLLMKINAMHKIQSTTVFRGHTRVSTAEVEQLFPGHHVSVDEISGYHGAGDTRKMLQLTDLFALPRITLLSDIHQYFLDKQIPFASEYLFQDVNDCVNEVHASGNMHRIVAQNPDLYLASKFSRENLRPFLQRLSEKGKKLFLMTNSPFFFIDAGLRRLVGNDWRDLFDVVITEARKPHFFSETQHARPFRSVNVEDNSYSWAPVTRLEKGQVYQMGNHSSFTQMTGWSGSQVLYFGDHVYGDLADPSLRNGWRTGAIISELSREIDTANTQEFRRAIAWKAALESLIENLQHTRDARIESARAEWKLERDQLRDRLKHIHHPRYGSLFRCFNNPSYFSRRLGRFADVYTSNLCNFIGYPVEHTFYPRRATLPHERYFMRRAIFHRSDILE